jgi:hypothetical protein
MSNTAPSLQSLELDETIVRLKACYARLLRRHDFSPGQIVRWKKGLRNKRFPAYGQPLIVLKTMPEPVFDTTITSDGNPYFREPLTLIVGILSSDGDLYCLHLDSRRLEPVKTS